MGGAVVMTVAAWGIAAGLAAEAWARRADRRVAAPLALSALSPLAAMVLAVQWALGQHVAVPGLSVDDMAATHGLRNGLASWAPAWPGGGSPPGGRGPALGCGHVPGEPGVRLVTVEVAGTVEPAALDPDGGLHSLRALGHASVRALVEAGPAAWDVARGAVADGALPWLGPWSAATATLPPLPDPPRNAFCVGTNYRDHIDELDRPGGVEVANPVIFTKPWTSLVGHGATVPLHPGVTGFVDWEAEIVVVIGVGGRDIAPGDALDHVFGYTLGNDVTARDLQKPGGAATQWFKGKALDGFGPTGPALVTADEVGDLSRLRAELTVNGETMQRLEAKDMIHPVAAIVSFLSRGMHLLPGDIVFTGTAAGVGAGQDPPVSLHDGDVVEITSPALGTLRNRFADRP